RGELDLLVAAQARIGGLPGGVGGDEVVDHVFLEAVGEIPDVERDAEHVGGPARVTGVLLGAAAARAGAQGARRRRQRQVHADHLVAGVDGAGGRDRRIHATAHRREYPHHTPPFAPARPAALARSITWGRTFTTASTSSRVEVCPKEKRNDPRAARCSTPMAMST